MRALLRATAIWPLFATSIQFTTTNFNDITIGVPFTIAWTGANGLVSLALSPVTGPVIFGKTFRCAADSHFTQIADLPTH
jgi:hypothetical protein